ncbi:MAG: universal stress protein [Bacteroidales bacterium]|nr:universal stress protein [Bacteroidales bacterium]
MKTTLLLTNFSETARKAITNYLKIFYELDGEDARFILFNAWSQPKAGRFQMINLDETLSDFSRQDLKTELDKIKKSLNEKDIKIELESRKGDLVSLIQDFAENVPIDLVVMGTKGSSIWHEVLVGSTTSRVVRLIDTPVLVIPELVDFKRPDKIVFASDLNECKKEEDFKRLTDIVRFFQSEFLILHIYEEEKPDVEYFESCMENYLSGINYSFFYVQNVDIAQGITSFTKNMGAGLLAMIEKEGNLLSKLFRHSVTNQLTLSAQHPLLIMHE